MLLKQGLTYSFGGNPLSVDIHLKGSIKLIK